MTTALARRGSTRSPRSVHPSLQVTANDSFAVTLAAGFDLRAVLASPSIFVMPKLIYQDSTGVERSIVLGTEPLLIGRSAECQVQTQDAMVSRRHARIFWDGGYQIEDLGSSNGVYVGQDKVQKAPFRPGDNVTCGSLVIRMVPDMRQPTSSLSAASLNAESHMDRTPPPAPPMPSPHAAPQPTMAVAAMSAPALPQAPSPSVSTARVMGDPQDLLQERARREQAEAALLQAAQKTQEYEGKIDKLKLHIEQLTAEVRREKRAAEDALASERQSRGMIEAERDLLRRKMQEMEQQPALMATASMGAAQTQELDNLKYELDRANRELRRAQSAASPNAQMEQELGQLRQQLLRTELDRDSALRQLSQQSRGGGAPDPAAADAAIGLNDALVDLRSSLRAATDESTMLSEPRDSVDLVKDSLRSATEQLEAARTQLRIIGKALGVA